MAKIMFVVTDSPYNAAGNGSTDDTAAIQSAINACAAAGGGQVYFPPGTYLISGPLQDPTSGNSQLLLPAASLDFSTVTIELVGPLPPPAQYFGFALPTTGYATIKSTLAGGNGSAALLGGPSLLTYSFGYQNNISCNVKNMIFELPPNPSLSAINLQYQQACRVEHVLVHAGTVSLGAVIQPTNPNVVGVLLPDVNHSSYTRVEGLNIFGMYQGISLGEMCYVEGLGVWACWQAIGVPFSYHPMHLTQAFFDWCPYGFVALGGGQDGTACLVADMFDIEHAAGAGQSWQNTVYDLVDPGNLLSGRINWRAVSSGVGNDHTFAKQGGANMVLVELGGGSGPPPPPTPTLTVVPTSGSIVDTQTLSITATLTNSTAALTATVAGGGVISTSNPTTGVSFTYTPPATGSGTAVITVTDATDGISGTCSVSYAPYVPPTPALTVSPLSGTVFDADTTLNITATLTNSTAALAASVTGVGVLSTAIPTSGIAFVYTPPNDGSSGTDVVTVTDATDGLSVTCSVTYGPAPTSQTFALLTSSPNNTVDYFVNPGTGTTSGFDSTGASLLVVVVTFYGQVGNPNLISDTYGNTWRTAFLASGNSSVCGIAVFYCQAPNTGPEHTVTIGGSSLLVTTVMTGFTGSDTSQDYDQINHANGTGSDPVQPGAVTPSADNELILSVCSLVNNGTPTIAGPLTALVVSPRTDGSRFGMLLGYEIQTAAAPRNPAFSNGAPDNRDFSMVVTFKAG